MNYFLFYKDRGRPMLSRVKVNAGSNTHLRAFTKLIMLLLTFFIFQSFNSAKAQNVTLNLKNASLAHAMDAIGKQTKYDFSYNDQILKKAKPVTLKLTNEPLTSALKKLFATQPLSFEIRDGVIIIYDNKSDMVSPSVGLNSAVNGKVTTEDGKVLDGATIRVKGTDYSTRTDQNGNFIIPGKYANELLEIRMMGYAKLEILAQRARVITLALQASELEEVGIVKTGYQEIDRRKLTSSVTTIKMDDILTPGINTIDKLLEGRVPGMIFMQNSGQVGATPKLRIRGTSTILGNREPLWVLDGIVLQDPVNVDPAQINDLDFVNLLGNAIAGLNPEDIDQIDVLKDASATALYGAKAGNGVIVITTKKGRAGKPMISYSMASGFASRPKYSDRGMYMMNSTERMDVSKEMVERKMQYNSVTQWSGYEAVLQDYYAGRISYDQFKSQSDYYAGVNTDWMGLLTKDAFSQNHTLSLSGGTQDVKYYSSIGYQNEDGVIRGENNKRYSTMLNITADYKKFMAQISFTGNYSLRNYIPSDLGVMNYAYNTSRTIPAYNADGSLFYYPRQNALGMNYNYNILNERDNANDHSQGIGANVKGVIRYKAFKGFNVEGTFAYGITNTNRETYYTKNSFYIFKLRGDQSARLDMAPIGGELTKAETTNNNYTARLQNNYTTSLGDANKHVLTFAAGIEAKSSEYKGFNIVKRGYFPEMGGYFDYISSATYTGYYQQWMSTKPALGTFDRTLTNELAWYGTGGYSWDNRYMLNVHIRGEQSNLFGRRSNNSFLPIWAVSGRWNMKNDIAKNTSWVNDLALKGSWGWQGNMLPGQAANMVIQQSTVTDIYYNSQYATIRNFPNPDLRWERTASSNAEVEFSLFGAKLNGSVGFFYKRTKDAFLNKVVSEINGVQTYVINSGTLENKGVELAFRITAIDNAGLDKSRRGFVWRFDPQLGQVLNKVLNQVINNRNNVLLDNVTYNNFLDGSIQLAGKPINTFYSYKFKGLSSKDGSPIFYGAEADLASQYQAQYSQMKTEDVYLAVMSESGRREPFIQGGISNYFGYRNFGFSFNVTYSLGNKIRMMKIASGYGSNIAYPQQNLRKEFVYRWRRPGDEAYTNIPGLQADNFINTPWWSNSKYVFAGSVYDMYDNSDIRLVSANHIKLQSASFRYNVPEAFAKKIGLGTAYLSLTGTNLFILSNKMLKGQDPTQSGSAPNINLSVRPTYAASINVSF